MLCVVIAWLAQLLFLVYQSHVLKLRKATLFLWPSPEPLCNKKKNIHMATVQILAFITLDGYLARRTTFPDLWEHPDKYGITVSGRVPCPALTLMFPSYPLRNGNTGTPAYILRKRLWRRFLLRTAFSALAWPTSWSCMSCPASRGKAPICSREVPGFPYGSWPGHGVSTGMSAACITDGSLAGNGCLSTGVSLNVISIL